jgi:hypothetical protein
MSRHLSHNKLAGGLPTECGTQATAVCAVFSYVSHICNALTLVQTAFAGIDGMFGMRFLMKF